MLSKQLNTYKTGTVSLAGTGRIEHPPRPVNRHDNSIYFPNNMQPRQSQGTPLDLEELDAIPNRKYITNGIGLTALASDYTVS